MSENTPAAPLSQHDRQGAESVRLDSLPRYTIVLTVLVGIVFGLFTVLLVWLLAKSFH